MLPIEVPELIALFRDGDIVLVEGFVIDIREVHIVELHTTELLQLLFDAAAHLQ